MLVGCYVQLPLGGDNFHVDSLGSAWNLADIYGHVRITP